MKNFAIVSGGRCGSSTLASHICNYVNAPLIHVDVDTEILLTSKYPSVVYKNEAPWLIEKIPNPERYSLILIDRDDQLAQVLSKCQLFIKQKAHRDSNEAVLTSITINKELFYFCAHHTLLFNIAKNHPRLKQFKTVYHLVYEKMIEDWTAVGDQLGFKWTKLPGKDYLGWGNVWDSYVNKEDILDWAFDCNLRFDKNTYGI
jgi:hypothetical protein